MNPWALLGGLLAYNYRRHLNGRHTLCSTARRLLPWPAIVAAWAALTLWLLPHIRRGYNRH